MLQRSPRRSFAVCFLFFFLPVLTMAQQNFFSWDELTPIPDPVGFAGSYAGVSNDALLVAGGANFPDGIGPWGKTPKTWYDQIYVLEQQNGLWKHAGKLPRPLGYGVSVTWGNSVIWIGGGNAEGHYRDVYRLEWKDNGIHTENLPDLPLPLANSAGVVLDDQVYITGGLHSPSDTMASNVFWRLDLRKPRAEMVWEVLQPVPGPGRMLAVAGAQEGHVYVFSGVAITQTPDGKVVREYLKDGYRFNDVNGWTKISELPHAVAAAPTPALTSGQSHLLIFGGDDGANADKAMVLKENHPGFRRDVLAYHTITDTWSATGEVAEGTAGPIAPVTTPLVRWNETVVFPGGEIRPGVRSTKVLAGKMEVHAGGFRAWDWTVLLIYFLLVAGISIYVSKTMNASTDDFFLGGQKIPWWAAGISIFGSKLSALTFIAIPAKTFATDWVYIFANLMIVAVAPVVIWFFLPYFRKFKITSVYEYLAIRFNNQVKMLGSLTFVLFQVGRLGIIIYLPALVLATITGIDLILCVILISCITTAYSIAGGIEAVIWTEVMQVFVLLGGAFLCLYFIADSVGGMDTIISEATTAGKMKMVNWGWSITEPVLWVVLVGNFLTHLTTYTSDQVVVQRYLTTPTMKEAKQSIYTNALLVIPATLIFFTVGTALWVFFKHNPGMLNPDGRIDDIFPWYIAQQLPAGLSGLVIAGLFAATMSTVSSSMNSIATVMTTDFYKFFRPQAGDRQRLRFARGVTFALGVLGITLAVALVYMRDPSIWDQYLKLIGLFGGCLAGMFIAGIFFPSINSGGVLSGFAISAVILYFIQANGVIHFFLYPGVGIFGCIIFGWLFSRIFPERDARVAVSDVASVTGEVR
jgi:solute:Na+ symporter, SSS family